MVNKPEEPGNLDAAAEADATPEIPNAAPGKSLSPAARRALEEANARRQSAENVELPGEVNGPSGEEPTRFGDWERKGIAVDF